MGARGSKLRAVAAGTRSPRWEEDALGFLIAPETRESFLERYYEKDALIALRGEPDRYADLLTLEALDHFIASADLREGMIDLTSQKHRILQDSYIDDRGRVSAVNSLFTGTSNQLGDFESGLTAAVFGVVPAVLLGGVGTVLVALLWMGLFPEIRRMRSLDG